LRSVTRWVAAESGERFPPQDRAGAIPPGGSACAAFSFESPAVRYAIRYGSVSDFQLLPMSLCVGVGQGLATVFERE
jgi:hypothetical protein